MDINWLKILLNEKQNKDVILASESFLKNFIMGKTKLNYKKIPADIDETIYSSDPVEVQCQKLSAAKCRKIFQSYPEDIIIAADT